MLQLRPSHVSGSHAAAMRVLRLPLPCTRNACPTPLSVPLSVSALSFQAEFLLGFLPWDSPFLGDLNERLTRGLKVISILDGFQKR
jgi:hypothetical protein